MSDNASDLVNITTNTASVTTRSGVVITCTQLKVKHLKRVFAIITPLYVALTSLAANEKPDYLALVTEHLDQAVELVSILSEKPLEVIGELDADELVVIFAKAVELNLDFFIKSVIPSLSGVIGHATSAMKKSVGSTSSSA